MVKIIEIKQTVGNPKLLDNIFEIQKITQDIINRFERSNELTFDDYLFIESVTAKVRNSLKKVNEILKI